MALGTERIRLSASGCLLGAMLLLVLPLRWLLAMGAAAMLHELGHLTAVWLMGARVLELRIGAFGMVMETEPLNAREELLAAAAGPAVSLALILLCRRMPRLAICGGIQGLYNLLPLYPLDGGRMLRAMLGKNGAKACRKIEISALGLLIIGILGIGILMRTGVIPAALLLMAVYKFSLQTGESRGTIEPLCAVRYVYDRIKKTHPPHGAEACPVYRRRVGRGAEEQG